MTPEDTALAEKLLKLMYHGSNFEGMIDRGDHWEIWLQLDDGSDVDITGWCLEDAVDAALERIKAAGSPDVGQVATKDTAPTESVRRPAAGLTVISDKALDKILAPDEGRSDP